MKNNTSTKILGVIDRIEDNKIVVINLNGRKGSMYIKKSVFNFNVYEGMWVSIKIFPELDKEKKMRLQIQQLQKELLSKSKKK